MVEMLAPVIAVHALGQLLRDRRILVFIDSEAVEGALVKGYSGKPDIDELAGAFWAMCVAGRVAPYIDRVPTDANPGDDPSRGVYDFLATAGAHWVESGAPDWLLHGLPWEAHITPPQV